MSLSIMVTWIGNVNKILPQHYLLTSSNDYYSMINDLSYNPNLSCCRLGSCLWSFFFFDSHHSNPNFDPYSDFMRNLVLSYHGYCFQSFDHLEKVRCYCRFHYLDKVDCYYMKNFPTYCSCCIYSNCSCFSLYYYKVHPLTFDDEYQFLLDDLFFENFPYRLPFLRYFRSLLNSFFFNYHLYPSYFDPPCYYCYCSLGITADYCACYFLNSLHCYSCHSHRHYRLSNNLHYTVS